MAEKRTGLQKIKEISENLWFCIADVNMLKEQDMNARLMQDSMMNQLAANIKKRGQLESVPFCCEVGGEIQIISGHHRVKAARMAGVTEIPILLDTSGLSASQIAAKQIAHNSISGYDDEDMLREIAKIIQDVDDMLESYYVAEFDVPDVDMGNFVHIKSELEFKQLSLVFLDNQIEDLKEFFRLLEQRPDYIGVAKCEDFDSFCDVLKRTQKVMDVKNVSAAVSTMIEVCNSHFDAEGYDKKHSYVAVRKILGGETCSKKAGETIKKAVTQMVKNGEAESKWQAMEKLAEDYLNGKAK